MSRWSREKHRRETAILQSFRDKLKYEIMKTIAEKILYGDGRDNEYDDIVMKGGMYWKYLVKFSDGSTEEYKEEDIYLDYDRRLEDE